MNTSGLQQTAISVLLNILLFLIIYLYYRNAKCRPYRIPQNAHIVATLLILVFNIFSFWGTDWFHLYDAYPSIQNGDRTHVEDVYVWMSQNIAANYYIFRIIVWGIALLLLYATFKRMSISLHLQLYMFVIFGLIWFSYARVSLAMAMMFYGASLLYRPYKAKGLSYIWGLGLIVASFFFHKSAIFGIGIIAIAMISAVLKPKTLILIVILLPLIYSVVSRYIIQFIAMDIDLDSGLSQSVTSAQSYLDRDEGAHSIMGRVLVFSERLSYIIIAFLSLRLLASSSLHKTIPMVIAIFMRILVFNILVSSFFLFPIVGLDFSVVSERFFRFSFIPATIIVSYLWEAGIFCEWTKWTVRVGLVMNTFALGYSFYIALLSDKI